MALPARLRVLCLHSWRTSGSIFREQFERARLLPVLEAVADLVFVDAPNPALGRAPKDVREAFPDREYREWFTTEGAEEEIEAFRLTYHGLEASEAFVERTLTELGPFDGIVGFSQGAIMAAAMAAMQRRGTALSGVPPLRFILLFGAAFSEHPRHLEAFLHGRVPIPTLHVIGHRDFVKQHSINLVRQFDAPIIIFHQRGHVIPPLEGPHLAVLRGFLDAILDDKRQGRPPVGWPDAAPAPAPAARLQPRQWRQVAEAGVVRRSKL
ncbi:hypothetical protein Rsub_07491 [Raphidocelis subcapitata]|uniref:Serine hydrolase domain-containing protein n=1 Tax=Raphidocelis subcapitata TaxID=307507 RepID=A0A2V0PAU7_9CHLO|nr:hypothetical protein Rsub_07491 [Raphidocelis subcapitata]|eukprot:GBF94990.1 hypothetical protein Rsub_07491 [Raphidocelis subcapitata]